MKKVINGFIYNTASAELIEEYNNRLSPSDFEYVEENLFRTPKGRFFLYVKGGHMSIYSEYNGQNRWGISDIIDLSDDEAYEWLVEKGCTDSIIKYFSEKIEEA